MAINFNSLLVSNAKGWHDGSGTITYSFLGSTMPAYYPERDLNGDGTNDHWRIDQGMFLTMGQSFSMSVAERALASKAIAAWNEVANINLVPGTITGTAGTSTYGSPITGNGTLVTPGGTTQVVPTNDDGFTAYDLSAVFENGMNFFGVQYDATSVYVNTNGSISFGQGIGTYTPTTISGGSTPMIAPFWADVDTRAGNPIKVNVDPTADVVTITWSGVGYFDQKTDLLNSFQLQLYDRGNGDFDIVFRYEGINWTTGDASGGTGGLGGTVAHAGFTAGNSTDFFELPQSGNQGAILALDSTTGNTGVTGLWVFEVRNGVVAGDITLGSGAFTDKSGTVDTDTFGFVSAFPKPNHLGTHPSRAGDFWVNTNNSDQNINAFGSTSWDTYLHELGHSLGLHHPNERPNSSSFSSQFTVMSYQPHPSVTGQTATNQAWPLTPMIWDIQALQKLYGANTATRNGDTVYFGQGIGSGSTEQAYQYAATNMMVKGEDGVNRNVILTIWDGGGTDLIDASSLTTNVKIDLRPGHFSTIGAIADNIGMSAAVKVAGKVVNFIENAEGGSGKDIIKGNATDNNLDGNAAKDRLYGYNGKDVLFGGGGNDTAFGGKGKDMLFGNSGRDFLFGQDGNDLIFGGGGKDYLHGGKGNDRLSGGTGDDTYRGGAGADRFVHMNGQGNDRIMDFADNEDTLVLSSALHGGGMTAADVVALATDTGTDIILDFGGGDVLRLIGAGGGGAGFLLDDMIIV